MMEEIRNAGFSGEIELDAARGKCSEWSGRELELGPCEGPWIRAASFHAVEASREFAVRLAMDPDTVWTPLSELRAMDPERGLIGVEGRNESLGVLNWLYPRRMTASGALRALEEVEFRGGKILPPAVVAACMAASLGVKQGLRRIERTPALFARLANAVPAGHPTDLSDAELEKYTEDFMDAALKGGFSRAMPGGAVDRARYWLGVAQVLWGGSTRKRLARCRLNAETAAALAELAAAWLCLKARSIVSVSGVTLRVGGHAKLHAWPQVMEWEYGKVSRKALQYLTGYHGKMLWPPEATDQAGERAGGEVKLRVDWPAAIKLGSRLLQDAAERATCRPCGSFRIAVPEGAPLTHFGVLCLRVWIVLTEGMWVTLEGKDRLGPSVLWRAVPPHLSSWILSKQIAPGLHLLLCALWRDLSVCGAELLGHSGPGEAGGEQSPKMLPSVRFRGYIDWGAHLKRGECERHTSTVRGHLRRLARNRRPSRRARKRAYQSGIKWLPRGMTFVSSHQRVIPEQATAGDGQHQVEGLATVLEFDAREERRSRRSRVDAHG